MESAGSEHVCVTYAPGGLEIFEEHHFGVELGSYVIESPADGAGSSGGSPDIPGICRKPGAEKVQLGIGGIQIEEAEIAVPDGLEAQFGHQFGV